MIRRITCPKDVSRQFKELSFHWQRKENVLVILFQRIMLWEVSFEVIKQTLKQISQNKIPLRMIQAGLVVIVLLEK